MKTTSWIGAGAAGVTLLCLTVMGPARAVVDGGDSSPLSPLAAATVSEGAGPGAGEDVDAAPLADAATIAEQEGRPVAEVEADLEWQQTVQTEIDRLAAASPSTFAGSRISHADRSVWVGFTGEPPAGASFPTGTTVEIQGGVPLSHEDNAE